MPPSKRETKAMPDIFKRTSEGTIYFSSSNFCFTGEGIVIILTKLLISISEGVEGSIQRKYSSEIFHLTE